MKAQSRMPLRAKRSRGFTLIELIIVVSIILILTAIAVPLYKTHVLHAREAVLREDLHMMREAIENYANDKDKPPQTLDDLVSAGYVRELPRDPFTGSNTTWEPVMDDPATQAPATEPGLTSVRSGSKMVGSDGTTYDTW